MELLKIALLLLLCLPGLAQGGQAFRFRIGAEPQSLDWAYRRSSFETVALVNIMAGLVEIDDHFKPLPALAERWQLSEDRRTLTFFLRPGVKWSDGKVLDAADFVFGWRRVLAPETKSEYAAHLFDIEGAKEFSQGKLKDFGKVGIRRLDALRLEIRLRRAVPNYVQYFYSWVTFPQRKDQIEKWKAEWWTPAKLVTLGPYRIKEWIKGRELRFERNPTYFGAPPLTETVVAVIEPDEVKARVLVRTGKIDALLGATTTDAVAGGEDTVHHWRVESFDAFNTDYLAFNVKAAPVSDVRLRQALAMALDRRGLPVALESGKVSADSMIPPNVIGHDKVSYAIDLRSSRKLLSDAGFDDPMRLPRLKLLYREGRNDRAAIYVRDIFKSNLGITVELTGVSSADFRIAVKSGKYHMFLESWWANYPEASCFMKLLLSDSAFNRTEWKSNRYDSLVNRAVESTDRQHSQEFYSEAQKILLREAAVIIPLYHSKTTVLLNDDVLDFAINPLQSQLYFRRVRMAH